MTTMAPSPSQPRSKRSDRTRQRKPDWLRSRRAAGAGYLDVHRLLQDADLHTVCQSANCPNRGECFNSRTATFLLMGDVLHAALHLL